PQTRTRNYNVTVYNTVNEQVPESYSVCVPVTTQSAVQVQVCKPVAVQVQVPVYTQGGGVSVSGGVISGGELIQGGGTVYSGGTATMIAPGSGCTNCSN
ncbi:MAG: hypothetical protein AAFP90_19770, partial [Planctomycetota bacterium]